MTSTQTPSGHDLWRAPSAPAADGPTRVIPRRPPVPPQWQWGPPMPPAPPGAPWPMPPAPNNGGNGKKWAIIAAATVAVAALATAGVVVATTGGSDQTGPSSVTTTTVTPTTAVETTAPTSEPEAAVIDPASVLLSRSDAEDLLSDSLKAMGTSDTLLDNSDRIDRAECMASWGPAERKAYAGSGYDEVAVSGFKSAGDGGLLLIQAAVSFDSPSDAQDYASTARDSWRGCADSVVMMSRADKPPVPVRFGSVGTGGDGFLTQSQGPDSPDAMVGCEHALGVSGALVIDTMVCGPAYTGQGLEAAEAIAKNVEQSA
ncbi:sensor domain-containing protein [Mycolicibacterium confluentis]|uniref:PknH-like extracellular domain-containing protein n=1 Tax=Mycolicibacterium confluentis TaxID=28047 RepID=A0A7I7XYH2_9MYCO|nr:sensor domain-containing protein [Mycolicibacterium confluentis]MCV7322018.1 sensor domain-containing protein [Mycolicibacterium confluentis]BBZ33842.1 hypothetical protein MCNF_24470 [Mycolicibacterium confluentis]